MADQRLNISPSASEFGARSKEFQIKAFLQQDTDNGHTHIYHGPGTVLASWCMLLKLTSQQS